MQSKDAWNSFLQLLSRGILKDTFIVVYNSYERYGQICGRDVFPEMKMFRFSVMNMKGFNCHLGIPMLPLSIGGAEEDFATGSLLRLADGIVILRIADDAEHDQD